MLDDESPDPSPLFAAGPPPDPDKDQKIDHDEFGDKDPSRGPHDRRRDGSLERSDLHGDERGGQRPVKP